MEQILATSPIFKGIKTDEIKSLLQKANFRVRTYRSGNMIALTGDECNNLLIVLEGSVKGEMIDYSGKTIKIEDIEAPRPIAPAFIFGNNNKYPVNIVANNEVRILYIPKESFVKLMQANAILLNNYLNAISSRTQFLSNKIKFLSFKTIKGKIAHYILQSATGDNIKLQKSQQELADYFGVTRPSLARAMGEMKDAGWIDVQRREIRIIDRKKLSELLQ